MRTRYESSIPLFLCKQSLNVPNYEPSYTSHEVNRVINSPNVLFSVPVSSVCEASRKIQLLMRFGTSRGPVGAPNNEYVIYSTKKFYR